jgi:hypothetical protein
VVPGCDYPPGTGRRDREGGMDDELIIATLLVLLLFFGGLCGLPLAVIPW